MILLILLSLACADPEPCDVLCDAAGFDNLSETSDASGLTCHCSGGDGLGGSVTEEACDDCCASVGGGDAEVQQRSEASNSVTS